MKRKLGLVFGGRSGEHEVSLLSARSIAQALDRKKFDLTLLAVDKSGNWYLADEKNYLVNEEDPKTIRLNLSRDQMISVTPFNRSNKMVRCSDGKDMGRLDVVFPIIHGTFGEDGSIQGFFSVLNIPCVGADVLGSAVGMNKLIAKKLLLEEGIRVADYLYARTTDNLEEVLIEAEEKLGYPVFVKPVCSGSSVGVSKAGNAEELKESIRQALKFDEGVLLEETITGREIECAILGNEELLASGVGEIIPKHDFYSYEAKYIDSEGARLVIPADINEEIVEQVREMAVRTYRGLFCSGMARVDMFLTENNQLVLNEINTLPGFTKISMYSKLMNLSGVTFSSLIEKLVDLAVERHTQRENHLDNVLKVSSY